MKLYYTTTAGQDQVQSNPEISLGGYRSSSLVPNNLIDNLFGGITQFLLSRDSQEEYIGLILENELSQSVYSIRLWFIYPESCYSKFLIAAVDLVVDSQGVLRMENIPNRYSKPLYATFFESDGEGNAVDLGDMISGEMVGLWISRQLIEDLSSLVCQESNLYEADPSNSNMFRSISLDRSDLIQIMITYNLDYYGGPIGGDEL